MTGTGTLTINNNAYLTSGKILPSTDDYVTVTSSGTVGGLGLSLRSPGQSVTNSGVLSGDIGDKSDGLALNDDTGGVAVNRGSISGYDGVKATAAPITLSNYASIYGSNNGVQLQAGGTITNGSTGSTAGRSAVIEGSAGVTVGGAAGIVTNFGTIAALVGSGDAGVFLGDGGNVTNGAVDDTNALIKTYGYAAVALGSTGATLANFGTVDGASDFGVRSQYGQQVTNGAATDHDALIEGYSAISFFGALTPGPSTVTNFGTIKSSGANAPGVIIGPGEVTNGGGSDRSALIEGASGIVFFSTGDTVKNFGTVEALGGAGYYGVGMGGGTAANGSVNNSTALIEGYGGLSFDGTGGTTNFGVIWGQGDAGGAGVLLGGGASLTNGSAGHQDAIIEGYVGVSVASAGTVTNFGSVVGEGGKAVVFGAATDELIVEAGSVFDGAVDGDRGLLDLASGAGTIVLAGSVLTVSGSMAATAFSSFGTVRVGVGASFKVSGDNTGVLSVVGGTLTSDGTVSGTGHVNIDTGIADLGAGFEEAVDFTGTTGELKLGSSKTYTGKITGFSKTGTTSLDLLDIAFAGTTTAVYTGTTTSGVLTVTEGANTARITLEGDYLSSTFTLSAAPGGGTLVVDPPKAALPAHTVSPAPAHQFIGAMAGFGASAAGSVGMGGESWRPPPPTLVVSRALA